VSISANAAGCLQDYLQSLNKKSAKPSLQWDRFDELSELSAEDDELLHTTAAAAASNKFIKKTKPLDVSQQPEQTHKSTDAALPSALGSANARCSALGKAESFAAKYSATREMTTLPSDSDLDLSLTPDEDVLADVKQTGCNTSLADMSVCLSVWVGVVWLMF